ncbi:TPA: 30S ribosomal protein S17 [Candidatus Woesearchaeota archaeon]|nr:30S ribosomal protein S17 [archaeon]HIJ12021.1 30S ribosomal protein S17 [Candidatus Woesearchaeota archaeon]
MTTTILGVKAPTKKCTDGNCPFHGSLNVKKETFKGTVIKRDSNHTATIEWFRPRLVPKYERYEIRRSRMRVHNPACVDAQVGQPVFVVRTRPLSKTKNAVILSVLVSESSSKTKAAPLKDAAEAAA